MSKGCKRGGRRTCGWTAACCGALLLVPAWAAAAPPDSPMTGQLVRLVIGLALVVVLLLLLAKFMSRFGGGVIGGARDSFRVVSSLPVGQRERVVVLQIGEQQLALGVAPGRVSLLHRLEEPLPRERSSVTAQVPAYSWLSRALGGRNQ